MITPRFSLEQTETQLIITIVAPYTKVKDTEIHVFEDDFRFFSKPYYLRLNLPGKVEETDNSSAKYHVDSNSFVVTLDKMTPGEVFQNLEMLTTMLQAKSSKNVSTKPLIEVLSSSSTDNNAQEEVVEEEEDWMIEQKMEEELPSEVLLQQHKYGFANTHSGLGTKYEVELSEVAEIRNPDSLSLSERKKLRGEAERTRFSDDHYLSDLMENDEIPTFLNFKINTKNLVKLSSSDQEQMKDLPNREFLLDNSWQRRLQLGLFDIIFSYCYDLRTTGGSHCIETPWNISRLSGTLCWFDAFDTVEEVVTCVLRRSLCYPLYRHWELSIATLNDALTVFKSGPVALLRYLLQIRRLFSNKDPYYLLNQLYIEEYCVWIQTTTLSKFQARIEAFSKAINEISKADVDLDLVELEAAAAAVEDEEMEEEMTARINVVSI